MKRNSHFRSHAVALTSCRAGRSSRTYLKSDNAFPIVADSSVRVLQLDYKQVCAVAANFTETLKADVSLTAILPAFPVSTKQQKLKWRDTQQQ
jgi:predicted ATPase